MLFSLSQVIERLDTGELLHISGNSELLKQLPKGNWIGGSTEYFVAIEGGLISDEGLHVRSIPFESFRVKSYDAKSISGIAADAYPHGFTLLIMPFDSEVHLEYAKNAPNYEDIFLNLIVGWISGFNLNKTCQQACTADGTKGEVYTDRAVALHVALPQSISPSLRLINIFEPDTDGPVIEFKDDSFSAKTCLVNGIQVNLPEYISEHKIDTRLPLIGDYSGAWINNSFKNITPDGVDFYSPVFNGIHYRFAKRLDNYADAFLREIDKVEDKDFVFSCNCILNFLYGELEGKNVGAFYGPITFGEIAYQLVNQTLVCLQVKK